jgi:pimeloyl-ACP methyl ester carboxylesterase
MGSTAVGNGAREHVVDGVRIELLEVGEGRPVLFLHGVEGIEPDAPWLTALAAAGHRVIAPSHPGFGHSEHPHEFRSVDDLAYFYLELLEVLDLHDAVLIGSSFGGWLAAEIAVRSTARIAEVVFVDALGIKVGGPRDRSVTDVHALSQAQVAEVAFHDPAAGRRDYSALSDHELLGVARSREAFAYFGWRPYMHNPGLRRWLRRIRVPALVVWGESDGIVSLDYGRAFAAELPHGRFATIAEAGHYPYVEQPARFVELVTGFLADAASPTTDNH